jgi:hypothetical protein
MKPCLAGLPPDETVLSECPENAGDAVFESTNDGVQTYQTEVGLEEKQSNKNISN